VVEEEFRGPDGKRRRDGAVQTQFGEPGGRVSVRRNREARRRGKGKTSMIVESPCGTAHRISGGGTKGRRAEEERHLYGQV